MQELIDKLLSLQDSEIKSRIDARLTEFCEIRNHDIETIFKELCFCIMTANCSALKCIEIHESIGDAFLTYSEEELIDKFKDLGYRFPNVRSRFIIEARNKIDQLKQAIESGNDGNTLREWIVKNIKGIGYKEASHFLRNIGFNDYAIIDFHIIDVLETYNIIQKPKTLTKRKYLEIEKILKELGKKLELNLAELDLFLWFLETGKILK